MKIYEVWHDGYDGCDETHSHWFARHSADETVARLNREQPQETFSWEVVEHEVSDLPPNAEVSEGGTRGSRIETAAQSRPSLH